MVECRSRPALSLVKCAGVLLCFGRVATAAEAPAKIAVFPFDILDTSGEGARPGQEDRAATATALLAKTLKATGRYEPVDLGSFAKEVASLQRPDECGECWAAVAKKAGARLEVLPSVHKVSTLITLMTLWFADVTTMQYVARVEGQIRGDTDEAYARGIAFLVTQELGKKPGTAAH